MADYLCSILVARKEIYLLMNREDVLKRIKTVVAGQLSISEEHFSGRQLNQRLIISLKQHDVAATTLSQRKFNNL